MSTIVLQTKAEKDQPNGYPGLDSASKVTRAEVPQTVFDQQTTPSGAGTGDIWIVRDGSGNHIDTQVFD